MITLETLLKALPAVGSAAARAQEFVELYNEASLVLNPGDQATAQAALADIQAGNDAGHARLQAKLAAAAKR